MGFILADGYVVLKNGKPYRLELALKGGDKEHLQKFASCVGYNGPIYSRKNIFQYAVKLNSPKLTGDLAKCGIFNKKSLTAEPLYFENGYLQKSFWRGMLDGDGTIFTLYPKDRKYTHCLGIIGTYSVCSAFRDYIKSVSSTQTITIEERVGCYRYLVASNKYVREIHSHFYDGSKIYLERKKNFELG